MTETTNAVRVDPEGYLLDPGDWSPSLAHEIAATEDIELTESHFEVLNYLRKQHADGVVLTIRRVGNSGVATIKELYQLFPGGPLKKSAKIAGIPKPASCV
jgi:dissimilatory sulfite reductase related protein